MIKDLLRYFILGGLLYGGHYFLSQNLPYKGLSTYRDLSHSILFTIFLVSHVLTIFLSRKFKILPGQVFLGFSVLKLILAGVMILLFKKVGDYPIGKSFTLAFMASYFAYLTIDVWVMLDLLKKDEKKDPN